MYEDTNDDYSGGDYNFIELSENKFELVKNLKKDFPTELLSEPKTTFGCPDCADQGGLVIQYANNGTIKSWRVDKSKSQVPSYLHNYMDKIEAAIEQINK
ncbi:MAG: hypothetical protein EOP53_22050 [Sphingobacteriales bacterium]|nr:MAG: hypothetical protein EOP53_22050 [Sphingobacteriales bacterium]